MARQLRPCGTVSAYQRHRYRGEPIDDACKQAKRDYQRTWSTAAIARSPAPSPCIACSGPRKPQQGAHGWCSACWSRWNRAGQPADGPPPRGAKRRSPWTARREDYRWLRSNGEPIGIAAQRIGITEKTAKRWDTAA